MARARLLRAIAVSVFALTLTGAARAQAVRVGSKMFTESVVLGELATDLARDAGAEAVHRAELGGTRVLWSALLAGEVDLYPEYTGTISHELLDEFQGSDAELRAELERRGVWMGAPLGFNNTYALCMVEARAAQLGVTRISDLAGLSELRCGFGNEFLDRVDGWPGLRVAYDLGALEVTGLDHELAYRALASGRLDVTDAYSTDADVPHYGLRLLQDDRGYFPRYDAVFLYRSGFARQRQAVVSSIERLAGTLDEPRMQQLNAMVKVEGRSEASAAASHLAAALDLDVSVRDQSVLQRLLRRGVEHLYLVLTSLFAAILLALPLGILAARRQRIGAVVLAGVGILQTIPSLALLVFMIPLLGIGAGPAIAALFLYSLLPIVRGTHAGLVGIAPELLESADALGLPRRARLRLVELPLASRSILSGIQTAAVINVGTATLGALIGAGGFGQPILTGVRLDDLQLILEGAVPAALIALAVQGLFSLASRRLVPRGLLLESGKGASPKRSSR